MKASEILTKSQHEELFDATESFCKSGYGCYDCPMRTERNNTDSSTYACYAVNHECKPELYEFLLNVLGSHGYNLSFFETTTVTEDEVLELLK